MRFRRARRPATYKIFYVADIHGSEKCFRKFVNAAKYYDVDALVLGGDVTGKALVPLVRHEDGSYEARFMDRVETARDPAELEEIEKVIRFNGFYPFTSTEGEIAQLETDPEQRERRFRQVVSTEVRRWTALADERLAEAGIPCLVMPGNDDESYVAELLGESEHITNPDERIVELGPYQVLSLGYSNRTPWHTPRELSEDDIEARLETIADALDPGRPTIFNVHVPPYGTTIDDAPEIREDLTLVGGSNAQMVPVGSPAVRTAIERHAPMLGLHGHIHESRGTARLDRTVCINPGSEYNAGVLKGVIVELRGDEVVNTQFVNA